MPREIIDDLLPSVLGPVRIQTAKIENLPMIEHYQRKWHDHIGFMPRAAQEHRLERGDYWRLELNGQDAGFLLLGAGILKPVRFGQLMVDPDLWRRGLGAACVARVKLHAAGLPRPGIRADVAEGLSMNLVAAATGARLIEVEDRQNRRRRRILRWIWTDHIPATRDPTTSKPPAITQQSR